MAGKRATSQTSSDLPTEIWEQIVGHFTLWHGEERYSFYGHIPDPWVHEENRNLQTLKNLCLVSKRFRDIGSIALYDTIHISRGRPMREDRKGLGCLLRTLLCNPKLRVKVKHLACDVNLLEMGYDNHPWSTFPRDPELIERTWHQIVRQDGLRDIDEVALKVLSHSPLTDVKGVEYNVTAQAILGAILCLATNLRTLQLQCPQEYTLVSRPPHPPERHSYTILSDIISTALTDPIINRLAPLGRLHSLRLLPDKENGRYNPPDPSLDDEAPTSLPGTYWSYVDICPALLEAPSLTSIRVGQLNGGSWRTIPQGLTHFMAACDSTSVYRGQRITYEDIRVLLSLPRLKQLRLYHLSAEVWANSPPDGDFLNSQLIEHGSKKLESVALTLINNWNPDLGGPDRSRLGGAFGPTFHLHCFSEFSVLRELDIQLFALIGSWKNLKTLRLETKLPPSLRKLALRELLWKGEADGPLEFGNTPGEKTEYMQDLQHMFIRFAGSFETRCPNLTLVKWYQSLSLPNRDLKAVVGELFAGKGVEFWQWYDGWFDLSPTGLRIDLNMETESALQQLGA
ncbi:hypothetical protein DL769_003512 [Monosporascus sp. CRB-8-3]|nr:hypothetical protein DL769_003512 [Monosporascus sp. CRB-8-3]